MTQPGSGQSALLQPLEWLIRRAREVRRADLKTRSSCASQVLPHMSFDECTRSNSYEDLLVGSTSASLRNMGQPSNTSGISGILGQDPGNLYGSQPLPDASTDAAATGPGSDECLLGMVGGGGFEEFDFQDFDWPAAELANPATKTDHLQQMSSEDWMDLARKWTTND